MISVVIPTHNRIDSLERALASVFRQTKLPQEVIVVDDGSAVKVPESVFSSAPSGVSCKLLRNNMPEGANRARNKGILEASCTYVAFLDDDDEFVLNKIELLESAITENPATDVFYHPAKIHMVNEKTVYYTKPKHFPGQEPLFKRLLVSNCIGGTPMVTVRKESVLDVGLFDVDLPALEDYELWLRLAKSGKKFLLINAPLTIYCYTTKKDSVSKGLESNRKAFLDIGIKYASDYETLSSSENKEHEVWWRKMVIQKAILNGDQLMAIKEQARLVLFHPGLRSVLSLAAVLLGPKMVFKLRSWIG